VPSSDAAQRFQDIVDNIARIERYTAGMNSLSFVEDQKTYDAVERCLARISEASTKLGSFAESLCPAIPWPKLRALGNVLRHEYDHMEGDRVWFMVEDDLPPLKAASQAALQSLTGGDDSKNTTGQRRS
jgi:uncharacterized protein with HEPN domain